MQQKYKIRNKDTRKGKVFVVRQLHHMTIEKANGSSINIAGIIQISPAHLQSDS